MTNNTNRQKLKQWKAQQAEAELRQQRIMRRLGKIDPTVQRWEGLMALRAAIAKEVAPVLRAKHEAELICMDVKFLAERPVKRQSSARAKASDLPPLTDHEYTPAWWAEAGKREAAARKAGLLVELPD
jgi:hypothetical protein